MLNGGCGTRRPARLNPATGQCGQLRADLIRSRKGTEASACFDEPMHCWGCSTPAWSSLAVQTRIAAYAVG